MRPTREPAGTVATRAAGLIEFSATLLPRRGEDLPKAPTLEDLPPSARCSVLETDAAGCKPAGEREILGEILALSEGDLGRALEGILRSLSIAAALSDAVLETRAARVRPARAVPAAGLQTLALDLRDAGFGVRFAPTWTPLAEGELGLGVLGAERELEGFLQEHPSWSMVRGR